MPALSQRAWPTSRALDGAPTTAVYCPITSSCSEAASEPRVYRAPGVGDAERHVTGRRTERLDKTSLMVETRPPGRIDRSLTRVAIHLHVRMAHRAAK